MRGNKNICTNKSKTIPVPASVGGAKTRLELHHISHFQLLSAPTFGLGLPWPSPSRCWQHRVLPTSASPTTSPCPISPCQLRLCEVMQSRGPACLLLYHRNACARVQGQDSSHDQRESTAAAEQSRRAHISQPSQIQQLLSVYTAIIQISFVTLQRKKKNSKKATSWVLGAGQLSP